MGPVDLEAEGEGIVAFLVPVSLGLEDLKALLPEEVRDAALVRRKLMTDEEQRRRCSNHTKRTRRRRRKTP